MLWYDRLIHHDLRVCDEPSVTILHKDKVYPDSDIPTTERDEVGVTFAKHGVHYGYAIPHTQGYAHHLRYATRNGLRMNVRKTKFISSEQCTEPILDCQGEMIEKVEQFRYLGSDGPGG
ncbi:unnamed protein product [Heligmosomoides polygyrus]|uniref:RNA-directed DNA polymerase n=1 Tax=Heligmosomoides polygyrus TaxID=6339 RepID=A0A3P8E4F7_HELPZ|nr:unnamed protein product [Heligmosomoides polygyrus]